MNSSRMGTSRRLALLARLSPRRLHVQHALASWSVARDKSMQADARDVPIDMLTSIQRLSCRHRTSLLCLARSQSHMHLPACHAEALRPRQPTSWHGPLYLWPLGSTWLSFIVPHNIQPLSTLSHVVPFKRGRLSLLASARVKPILIQTPPHPEPHRGPPSAVLHLCIIRLTTGEACCCFSKEEWTHITSKTLNAAWLSTSSQEG